MAEGLEQYTKDELLDELHKRFPCFVFAAVKPSDGDVDDDDEDFWIAYRGGLTAAIGCAERGRDAMCVQGNTKIRLARDGEDDDER